MKWPVTYIKSAIFCRQQKYFIPWGLLINMDTKLQLNEKFCFTPILEPFQIFSCIALMC